MSDGIEKGDHLIALYDVRVWEDGELVFLALGVQGGGSAHTLVADWLKRRRSPGKMPDHECKVEARLVSANSVFQRAQR